MKEKIILVSDERGIFYNLSLLIPEMMKVEGISKETAISYFMDGLKCDRYMVFPQHTSSIVVANWVMSDTDIYFKEG